MLTWSRRARVCAATRWTALSAPPLLAWDPTGEVLCFALILSFTDNVWPNSVIAGSPSVWMVNAVAPRDMQKAQAEAAVAAVAEAQVFIDEQEATGEYLKMENGILYQVLEEGNGPMPVETDVVKVNYEGTNTKGEVFDSSYERGAPAEFPLNRVIKGWTETLKMMPTGSTWKVVIPSGLSYGERASPPKIGPNEPLMFKTAWTEIVQTEAYCVLKT